MIRTISTLSSGPSGTQLSDGARLGSALDVDGLPGVQETPYQVYQIQPQQDDVAALVPASIVTGSKYLALGADSASLTKTMFNGEVVYQLDAPRGLSVSQLVEEGAVSVVVTIWSYDIWGNKLCEQITSIPATTVPGEKSHYFIRRIYCQTQEGGSVTAISVGNTNVFGLPYYTYSFGQAEAIFWDNAIAPAPAAITFSPGSAQQFIGSDDVRGTVTAPSRPDGVKRLIVHMAIPGALGPCGGLSGQSAVQGVPQFNQPYF